MSSSGTLRTTAVVGLLTALLALASCASPVTAGVVIAKDFREAHTVQDTVCAEKKTVSEYGLNPATGKYGYRYVRKCVRYEDVPREVPASYRLVIGEEKKEQAEQRTGTYEVPQSIFEEAQPGYHYDSKTGELQAR